MSVTGNDVEVVNWFGSSAPTVGQKLAADSIPVVLPAETVVPVGNGTELPTYAASTNGVVVTLTAIAAVTSISYLFHPAANALRTKIRKIVLSWTGNGGNNSLTARGNFITAENAVPGGTVQAINPLDRADAASTLTFRTGATGAPVRVAGDMLCMAMIGGTAAQNQFLLFDSAITGKPIILRAGVDEGFEIRTVIGGSALGGEVRVATHFIWTEE